MSNAKYSNRFPPAQHDHGHCVATAVETAEGLCRRQGLRFTSIRRRVLELVWNSHTPVGAYDILESINSEGKKAAPPTVYRALDFLIEANLVHRLDSINAFVGCPDPGHSHAGQFLICRECRSVAELDDTDINELVERKVSDLGFSAIHQTLEIQGLCQDCRDA
jgi:Fur family zinc uptake transcriptional regulator